MSKQNKTNKTESQNTSNQTQNQDSKNQNGRTPVHGVLPFFMSVRPQGCTAL